MAEKQQLVEIVHKLHNGNRDAATTLYEAYYRDLHYYILKRVNDPEKAETLTQDTFIEIFDTIGTLDSADEFVEWSRKIADRRCDEYRKARKNLLSGKVGSATVDSVAEERKNLHSDELDNEQTVQSLDEIIDSLSEGQRAMVLKSYVDGIESDDSKETENEDEERGVFSIKGFKAGAKVVESIVRKVLVGVVAALILTVIRGGGVDWLYKGQTAASEGNETPEQAETTETPTESSTEAPTETATEISTPEETEPEQTTLAETEAATTKAEETEPQIEETAAPEMVKLRLTNGYWEVVDVGTYISTDIVIPATYDGLPIEYILAEAFMYNHGITSMQLSDGMLEIRDNAFRACEKMTRISLPDSIHFIGTYAFSDCISLTSITLPARLEQIKEGTFNGCKKLTQVTFSENISSIGNDAFCGCESLTEINIPAGVRSIAADAFYYCNNLEKIVVDAGNPIYYSVDNCLIAKSSKKLVLCGNRSVIPMDGSIRSIGDYACGNCKEWTEVVIPAGVTSIGNYAFDALKLEKITIPVSVTSIGERAFGLGGKLKMIVYGGTVSQWKAIEKGVDWNLHSGNYTVYCTDGEITQWEDFN